MTPDEYRRLDRVLKEAEQDGSVWPSTIAAIRLLMLTGCPHSEFVSLRWDDVDRAAGGLRLRDAKTGPRMVPLTEPERVKGREAGVDAGRSVEREGVASESEQRDRAPAPAMEQSRSPKNVARNLGL